MVFTYTGSSININAADAVSSITSSVLIQENKIDSESSEKSAWKSRLTPINYKPRYSFRGGITADIDNKEILWSKNADNPFYIASITKLMTVLLAFEKVKKGEISLEDTVTVSRRASRIGGSQVYLAQGEKFRLIELIEAALIFSANDAAFLIGEYIGGSNEDFIEMMNDRSKSLGLNSMFYSTSTGLYPRRGLKHNSSSAYDLLLLADEVLKYPKILEIASTDFKLFRDGKFYLSTRNTLARDVDYIDGLKTGFYWQAGFCIVATGEKEGRRVVSVLLGAKCSRSRNYETKKMIDAAFDSILKNV